MTLLATKSQLITVSLSSRVHTVLSEEAKIRGQDISDFARDLFEDALSKYHRAKVDADMQAFVAEYAGTEWDFDPALAAAGAEVILHEPSGFEKNIPEHLRVEFHLETR